MTSARGAVRAHDDGHRFVVVPRKTPTAASEGRLDLLTESTFLLQELGDGASSLSGTYVVGRGARWVRFALDDAGRASLSSRIGAMSGVWATSPYVRILSTEVRLDSVSHSLLHVPPVGRTRRLRFRAKGAYRVTWRYDFGFPVPPYYGISTWRFGFREDVTVGAAL